MGEAGLPFRTEPALQRAESYRGVAHGEPVEPSRRSCGGRILASQRGEAPSFPCRRKPRGMHWRLCVIMRRTVSEAGR